MDRNNPVLQSCSYTKKMKAGIQELCNTESMKLKPHSEKHIRESFAAMTSQEDFLALLNYVKKLRYGENTIPFALKHLMYHSNPDLNQKRYLKFSIKKKSGGERTIHAPNKGLKIIQQCLNSILQAVYTPHAAANGFIPGKSIVSNAYQHTGKHYVYNIDLKDFFPSIDQARVWARLKYPPFNLNEEKGRLMIANRIASLCCHKMDVERLDADKNWIIESRNVLPQGAPTSPFLTNVICQKLDHQLATVTAKSNVAYTRYADDITFSSMHNVYQPDSPFLRKIEEIISGQGFTIKESKTRLQKQGYRQEVTGLIVNEKINVHRHMIKQVRLWLFYWEKFGIDRASVYFLKSYCQSKVLPPNGIPDLINVLGGKLDFIRMVKGADNKTYKDLYGRFNLLLKLDYYHQRQKYLAGVVNNVLTQGISEGLRSYDRY